MPVPDRSHGYEALAAQFIRERYPEIGLDVVRDWARGFPPGAMVLELGCGHGVVSPILIEAELELFALDASPILLAAFRARFPNVETECAAAEESAYFGRTFDGILAIGLLFLLDPDAQRAVLRKAAGALRPGGRLLFTAPLQVCEWTDILTGKRSESLGAAAYQDLLREEGLQLTSSLYDEGENHYFSATKRAD